MTPHPVPVPPGPFIGTCLVAGFAVFWAAAGARSLPGKWPVTLSLAGLLLSAIAVWHEYAVLRAGTHRAVRFDGAAYGIAVTFEGVAIPLTAALLKRRGQQKYILPAVAFIAGLHFFGLVWAFDSPACWWIGGAMCLLPVAAVTGLPVTARRDRDGGETRWWDVVVGFGCATILWWAIAIQF